MTDQVERMRGAIQQGTLPTLLFYYEISRWFQNSLVNGRQRMQREVMGVVMTAIEQNHSLQTHNEVFFGCTYETLR